MTDPKDSWPGPAMVFDGFMFSEELDVLEIRLHELDEVVDRFVMVEATVTHSGRPRELVFPGHRQRFGRFLSKIAYVPLQMAAQTDQVRPSPWQRERLQRDHIYQAVLSSGAQPEDSLIVSDVDEIPRATTIAGYRPDCGFCKLDMALFYYFLNLCVVEQRWTGAFIVPIGDVKTGLTDLRALRGPILADGGWHFSYVGGVPAIQRKLQAFAHVELNTPSLVATDHIRRCLAERKDLFGRDWSFQVVSLDEDLPGFVKRNQRLLQHLLIQAVAA